MAKIRPVTVKQLPYYTTPANDNEILLNYQYEYKNGNASALSAMYTKLVEVAYKTINNRSKKSVYIAQMLADERQQKAHDAATYIIEQYLKRPAFVIEKSLTGYLYLRVNWELYGRYHQKKSDSMLEFVGVPQGAEAKTGITIICTNVVTGATESFNSLDEMRLIKRYKRLSRAALRECVVNGAQWGKYKFDILEYET